MAWLNVDKDKEKTNKDRHGCTYVGRTLKKRQTQIYTLMKCEWLFGTFPKKKIKKCSVMIKILPLKN